CATHRIRAHKSSFVNSSSAVITKSKHQKYLGRRGSRPYQIFMSDKLNKATVLVLSRNWQAINIRTPADAICQMATGVATALEIVLGDGARAEALRPVSWSEWITLPVREQDQAIYTVRGAIRLPTVIVLANFAKVPKKRPKFCARNIRDRDG